MIPVYQQKFGSGGSCFDSCIASILELPVKDVPHFNGFGEGWGLKLWDFLKPFGLSYTSYWVNRDKPPQFIPRGYHLINGYAPRGYRHSVVGFKGVFVHDPFPGGNGLITVEEWGIIHPIDQDLCEQFMDKYEAKS